MNETRTDQDTTDTERDADTDPGDEPGFGFGEGDRGPDSDAATHPDPDADSASGSDADSDSTSGSDADGNSGADDTGPPDEDERLEALRRRIESVRSEAADAVAGVDEPEETFADSGSEKAEREDDQTIAPG